MSLSRDYTLIKFYREAAQDLQGAMDIPRHVQKDLVNRAVATVAGQIYDLSSNFYMTEVPIVGSVGAYETGTTGTYTVLTQTLALQTPSRSIVSTDVGKYVSFRISTSTYSGIIQTIVSTSSFTIIGVGLPIADGTLAEVIIIGNTVNANKISLTGLRMMMAGQQTKMDLLTSTSGVTVRFGSIEEVDVFRTDGRNINTILWAINGDYVQFVTGDNVIQGTLTLRYPKSPDLVTVDASGIDLPDGTAIDIGILYLRGLIQQRLTGKKENNESQMQQLIGNMVKTFTGEANAEAIKEKVMALK